MNDFSRYKEFMNMVRTEWLNKRDGTLSNITRPVARFVGNVFSPTKTYKRRHGRDNKTNTE